MEAESDTEQPAASAPAVASDEPMAIRRPCSARSRSGTVVSTFGGAIGRQNGAREISVDQPSTSAKARKLADAFSGEPVFRPAVKIITRVSASGPPICQPL